LKVVGTSDHLAVDANAGFSPERTREYAKALKPYQLRWFEEPTDPLDYELLAEVTSMYPSPIGTGENLFSTQDIKNLVHFGGMRPDRDILQIDVPQSYGIVQFGRTLKMLESRGWSRQSVFPHGGNLMTLAIVAGFGLGGCEAYPGTFGVFAGFADDSQVENGLLTLSDRPGIGFEGQNALYAVMRQIALN
jgi:L-alanine-DL-glutamate epimerase-like enolase superfamily enzyme